MAGHHFSISIIILHYEDLTLRKNRFFVPFSSAISHCVPQCPVDSNFGFLMVCHVCPKYCILVEKLNTVYTLGRNTVQKCKRKLKKNYPEVLKTTKLLINSDLVQSYSELLLRLHFLLCIIRCKCNHEIPKIKGKAQTMPNSQWLNAEKCRNSQRLNTEKCRNSQKTNCSSMETSIGVQI